MRPFSLFLLLCAFSCTLGQQFLQMAPPTAGMPDVCQGDDRIPPPLVRLAVFITSPTPTGVTRLGAAAVSLAVESVNRQLALLPRTRIAADFYVTDGESSTLLTVVNLLQEPLTLGRASANFTLVGIIGHMQSDLSAVIQNVAQVFHIPQVSYASVSPKLSDNQRYPYFFRTLPSDRFYASAIADTCRAFGWERVSYFGSNDLYGQDGLLYLADAVGSRGVQLVQAQLVDASANTSGPWEAALNPIRKSGSRVILSRFPKLTGGEARARAWSHVLGFLGNGHAVDPEQWAMNEPLRGTYMVASRIFPDGPGTPSAPEFNLPPEYTFEDLVADLTGMIGVEPSIGQTRARDGLTRLLQQRAAPLLGSNGFVDPAALFAADSVWTYALAMDRMIADGYACYLVGSNRNGTLLRDYMSRLQFEGASGVVAFDANNDRANISFDIINLQSVFSASSKAERESRPSSLLPAVQGGVSLARPASAARPGPAAEPLPRLPAGSTSAPVGTPRALRGQLGILGALAPAPEPEEELLTPGMALEDLQTGPKDRSGSLTTSPAGPSAAGAAQNNGGNNPAALGSAGDPLSGRARPITMSPDEGVGGLKSLSNSLGGSGAGPSGRRLLRIHLLGLGRDLRQAPAQAPPAPPAPLPSPPQPPEPGTAVIVSTQAQAHDPFAAANALKDITDTGGEDDTRNLIAAPINVPASAIVNWTSVLTPYPLPIQAVKVATWSNRTVGPSFQRVLGIQIVWADGSTTPPDPFFYDGLTVQNTSSSGLSSGVKAAIAVPVAIAGVALLVALAALLWIRRVRSKTVDEGWLIDPAELEFGEEIGQGAHGVVYEGKYRGSRVAIKVVHLSPEGRHRRSSHGVGVTGVTGAAGPIGVSMSDSMGLASAVHGLGVATQAGTGTVTGTRGAAQPGGPGLSQSLSTLSGAQNPPGSLFSGWLPKSAARGGGAGEQGPAPRVLQPAGVGASDAAAASGVAPVAMQRLLSWRPRLSRILRTLSNRSQAPPTPATLLPPAMPTAPRPLPPGPDSKAVKEERDDRVPIGLLPPPEPLVPETLRRLEVATSAPRTPQSSRSGFGPLPGQGNLHSPPSSVLFERFFDAVSELPDSSPGGTPRSSPHPGPLLGSPSGLLRSRLGVGGPSAETPERNSPETQTSKPVTVTTPETPSRRGTPDRVDPLSGPSSAPSAPSAAPSAAAGETQGPQSQQQTTPDGAAEAEAAQTSSPAVGLGSPFGSPLNPALASLRIPEPQGIGGSGEAVTAEGGISQAVAVNRASFDFFVPQTSSTVRAPATPSLPIRSSIDQNVGPLAEQVSFYSPSSDAGGAFGDPGPSSTASFPAVPVTTPEPTLDEGVSVHRSGPAEIATAVTAAPAGCVASGLYEGLLERRGSVRRGSVTGLRLPSILKRSSTAGESSASSAQGSHASQSTTLGKKVSFQDSGARQRAGQMTGQSFKTGSRVGFTGFGVMDSGEPVLTIPDAAPFRGRLQATVRSSGGVGQGAPTASRQALRALSTASSRRIGFTGPVPEALDPAGPDGSFGVPSSRLPGEEAPSVTTGEQPPALLNFPAGGAVPATLVPWGSGRVLPEVSGPPTDFTAPPDRGSQDSMRHAQALGRALNDLGPGSGTGFQRFLPKESPSPPDASASGQGRTVGRLVPLEGLNIVPPDINAEPPAPVWGVVGAAGQSQPSRAGLPGSSYGTSSSFQRRRSKSQSPLPTPFEGRRGPGEQGSSGIQQSEASGHSASGTVTPEDLTREHDEAMAERRRQSREERRETTRVKRPGRERSQRELSAAQARPDAPSLFSPPKGGQGKAGPVGELGKDQVTLDMPPMDPFSTAAAEGGAAAVSAPLHAGPRPPILRRLTSSVLSTVATTGRAFWRAVSTYPLRSGTTKSDLAARRSMLQTELARLVTLRHPRLVLFMGAAFMGEGKDQRVCLVMEHMEGGSLQGLLRMDGLPLDLDVQIRLAKEIAMAMSFLHLQKPPVIHRDLKPSNTLLDDKYSAKIADLGLSLTIDEIASATKAVTGRSQQGAQTGTGTASKSVASRLPSLSAALESTSPRAAEGSLGGPRESASSGEPRTPATPASSGPHGDQARPSSRPLSTVREGNEAEASPGNSRAPSGGGMLQSRSGHTASFGTAGTGSGGSPISLPPVLVSNAPAAPATVETAIQMLDVGLSPLGSPGAGFRLEAVALSPQSPQRPKEHGQASQDGAWVTGWSPASHASGQDTLSLDQESEQHIRSSFFSSMYAGTLPFLAPEILLGHPASTASDVYSFGILLWELITRRQPFDGVTPQELIDGVVRHDLRPLRPGEALPPEVMAPQALLDLMQECWSRNPDRRPAFPEIVERLSALESSHQVQRLVNARRSQNEQQDRRLLLRMLPAKVANALKQGKRVEPEHFDCCTIFFCDIVGYTGLASRLAPHEVMDLLHRLYLEFDQATLRHELFKVETIGDSYMVVGNLAQPQPDHALRVARFALDIRDAAARVPVHPDRPDLGTIRIRSGFHSGPVVASVVGDLNPRYCLFGDTVNMASRMESHSVPMGIQLSSAAHAELQSELRRSSAELEGTVTPGSPDSGQTPKPEDFGIVLTCRGRTEVKGKGKIITFWLERNDGEPLRQESGDSVVSALTAGGGAEDYVAATITTTLVLGREQGGQGGPLGTATGIMVDEAPGPSEPEGMLRSQISDAVAGLPYAPRSQPQPLDQGWLGEAPEAGASRDRRIAPSTAALFEQQLLEEGSSPGPLVMPTTEKTRPSFQWRGQPAPGGLQRAATDSRSHVIAMSSDDWPSDNTRPGPTSSESRQETSGAGSGRKSSWNRSGFTGSGSAEKPVTPSPSHAGGQEPRGSGAGGGLFGMGSGTGTESTEGSSSVWSAGGRIFSALFPKKP